MMADRSKPLKPSDPMMVNLAAGAWTPTPGLLPVSRGPPPAPTDVVTEVSRGPPPAPTDVAHVDMPLSRQEPRPCCHLWQQAVDEMTQEGAGAALARALATLKERTGGRQTQTETGEAGETAHDATAARGQDEVHAHETASAKGGGAPAWMHGCGAASACRETCQALLALLM